MKSTLKITPEWKLFKILDKLITPFMYVLSGSVNDSPQSTHHWNSKKLKDHEVALLEEKLMVFSRGEPTAMKRRFVFLFHIPILGGWRDYVVLDTDQKQNWYLGWRTGHGGGVSQIELLGPVRVLKGPEDCWFFGIGVDSGEQIGLKKVGEGRIGEKSKFSKIKLV